MVKKAEFVARVEAMLDPSIVRINDEAIEALDISQASLGAPSEPPPPAARTERDAVWFSLALNAINHQFWEVENGRFTRYEHEGEVGALAMRSSLSRMLTDAGSMEALSLRAPLGERDIRRWFGPMPDPRDRALALSEALGEGGKALAQSLVDHARAGGEWGVEQAERVARLLPTGYEDPLLKKAQLCLWMGKGMLEALGFTGPPVDLTAFADYQIPKALRGLGVLEYSPELSEKIAAGELLEQGGVFEMAIRNATVAACERIARAKGISAPALDFWLWLMRNQFAEPFHRAPGRRY